MRRNFKKIFLIIVCGVVACAAISHVVRSWRTKQLKQEIADIRRTLREQGFKTEFDDFKITTDPAMRARAKTLLDPGDEPKLNTNGDILVFQTVVSNGTASVIWKQDLLTLDEHTLQWEDFRAALNSERQRLDAACDAAPQGPIQFDLDMEKNRYLLDDNIVHWHHLSRTLGDRVLLGLHDGQSDTAWTNLLATTLLVTTWKVEPFLISHLLLLSMTDETLALTWQALQFKQWPDNKLSALQNEWESADVFTNLSEMMSFEGAKDADTCQRLAQNPRLGFWTFNDSLKEIFESPRIAYRDAKDDLEIVNYAGPKALADVKRVLLFYRDRNLEVQNAIQSPTWAQMRALPGITNPIAFAYSSQYLTRLLTDHGRLVPLLMESATATEAERKLLIAAIALERYRGRHGSYPNSLAQLTPEFLKAVPLDFMDGQPLRYRPTSDGHFVLYSVGLDCVDDGGKPPAFGAPSFLTNHNGKLAIATNVDIVWPVPASP